MLKIDKKLTFFIFCLSFFIFLSCNNFCLDVFAKDFNLTIFSLNDTHGHVGHEPYLRSLIKQKKAKGENTLILSAGDTFHGQLMANLSHGKSIAHIMNEVGYDYITPGNHDFNYRLLGLQNLMQQAKFECLSANIVHKSNNSYVFKPYDIKNFNGVKVGIFGITTPETKISTGKDNIATIDFLDPVSSAQKVVKELKAQGADITIAVTHLGLSDSSNQSDRSDNLAKQVSGIDMIVDGHSHTVLQDGLWIDNTLIIQSGEYGEYIGMTDLTLDSENKLSISPSLINISECKERIEPDKDILQIIEEENERTAPLISEKICEIDFCLDGQRESVRLHETNLSDLITDAILQATDADLAVINGGSIRNSILPGTVTRGDILQVSPFTSIVVTQEVTGRDILKALIHGCSQYPQSSPATIHVSGVTFKVKPIEPNHNYVFDVNIQGLPLDLNKKYIIASNEFIASGGDGYEMLANKENYTSHCLLEDCLIDHIKKSGDLSSYKESQQRIKIENLGSEVKKYIIKANDNLSTIARRYNTSWQKLAILNSIKNPNLIFTGDVLLIA